MIEKVVKRGGEIVDVDKNKIIQAIIKAMEECDNIDEELAIKIADSQILLSSRVPCISCLLPPIYCLFIFFI